MPTSETRDFFYVSKRAQELLNLAHPWGVCLPEPRTAPNSRLSLGSNLCPLSAESGCQFSLDKHPTGDAGLGGSLITKACLDGLTPHCTTRWELHHPVLPHRGWRIQPLCPAPPLLMSTPVPGSPGLGQEDLALQNAWELGLPLDDGLAWRGGARLQPETV